jgi:hypothetical protein
MFSTGPQFANLPVSAWLDIITFFIAIYLVLKIGGGKIMYSVWLVGATGLVGFLALWFGGAPAFWIMSTIKSAVLLFSIIWLVIVFK